MAYSEVISLTDMELASNILKGKIEVCFNENKDNEDFPNIIKDKFKEEFIEFREIYSSVPNEIINGEQRLIYFLSFGGIWNELINYQDTLNAIRHGQL